MKTEQPFWNPIIETLPLEKIRRLQLKKFQKIFQWAYDHSKFHRKLYNDAGIKPEDIRSFEDIRRVPTVEKSMPSGPGTMPPKSSVARLFREVCWIPKPGSSKFRNYRLPP